MIDKKSKKFKIKVPDDPNEKKKNKINRGAVCIDMVPATRITDIIIKLGIKPDIDIKMKKRDEFINSILGKTENFKKNELKEMDDDELKVIYFWYVKAKKAVMCDTIQKWFAERNLILEHEL